MRYENLTEANKLRKEITNYKAKLTTLIDGKYTNIVIYEDDCLLEQVFQTGANPDVYSMQELQPLTNDYINQVCAFIENKISALEIQLDKL